MGLRSSRILKAILIGGSISSAGCEQSFVDENPSVGSIAVPANDSTPEATKQLARSVGSFISASTTGNSAYKIGAQDVLEIVVFKVPELTRNVQVGDSGSINLPLVGDVIASGRTAQELERDLAARLGAKFLKSPQVSVYVREFNSRRVTIEGAVRKPGVFPVRSKISLLQLIAIAGGVDRDVAADAVMVFRTRDGERIAGEFNIDDIREGRASDPAIDDGDVIVVPTSAAKVALSNFLKITPALAAFRPTVW